MFTSPRFVCQWLVFAFAVLTILHAPLINAQPQQQRYRAATPTIAYQSGATIVSNTIGNYQPIIFTSRITIGNVRGVDVIFTITGTQANGTNLALTSSTITSDSTGLIAFSLAGGLPPSRDTGYTVQVFAARHSNTPVETLSAPFTFIVTLSNNSNTYALQADLIAERTTRINNDQIESSQRNASDIAESNLRAQADQQESTTRISNEFAINQSIQQEHDARLASEGVINSDIQQVNQALLTEKVARIVSMAALNQTLQGSLNQTLTTNQHLVDALNQTMQQGFALLGQTILSMQAQIDRLSQPKSFIAWSTNPAGWAVTTITVGSSDSASSVAASPLNPKLDLNFVVMLPFRSLVPQVTNGLSYDPQTGITTITNVGYYRLDATVSLWGHTPGDSNPFGGVMDCTIAWCSDTSFIPIGINLDQTRSASPYPNGVYVTTYTISTLLQVQPTDLPKKVRLVLLSTNQMYTFIFPASMSITQL